MQCVFAGTISKQNMKYSLKSCTMPFEGVQCAPPDVEPSFQRSSTPFRRVTMLKYIGRQVGANPKPSQFIYVCMFIYLYIINTNRIRFFCVFVNWYVYWVRTVYTCFFVHVIIYTYIYIYMSSFGNQVPQNPITGLHINMVILRYLPMFRIAHIFCVKK